MSRNRMTEAEIEGHWKARTGDPLDGTEKQALRRFREYPDPEAALILATKELQLLEYKDHRGLLEAMVVTCMGAMGYERWKALKSQLEGLEPSLQRLLRMVMTGPEDPKGRPWGNALIRAIQAAQRKTREEKPARTAVLDKLKDENVRPERGGRWLVRYEEEGLILKEGSRPNDRVDPSPLEDATWPFLRELSLEERRRAKRSAKILEQFRLEIAHVTDAD